MFAAKRISLLEIDARRIALIKPSALGDIAHSLPVLHALRQRFPESHITWIVNRSYADLLEGHPDLDEVMAFDRGAMSKGRIRGAWAFYRFLMELRRRSFDLAVDLQGLLRTGLMTAATGAGRKIGLGSAREGASWFYTDVIPVPDPNLHAVDRYWLVAEALGAGHLPKRFALPTGSADETWAESELAGLPRPWVMLNMGTRWETKRWPVRHFTQLIQRTLERFGGTAILVGGPEERSLAEPLAGALGFRCRNLVGATRLRQLVAVLARADLLISNDSGPLHIAAALGRPVVAPFTCTSPARTGPYARPRGAVLTQVDCAASYLKKCNRMVCMNELTPDRLWPAVEAELTQWQRECA